jgi:sugar O-acyltransferase (sialic acid O-acetyltransferase NeuD family)
LTKIVGIFGTSGMAREVRDIAKVLGYSVFFVALDRNEVAKCEVEDTIVLESEVMAFSHSDFIIGIGDGNVRRKLSEKYEGRLKFINLVHPSATLGISPRKILENLRGVVVAAGVRIANDVSIGNFALFNFNCTVSHDSIVAPFVTISPLASVLGNVDVGAGSWIGAGATILQGSATKKIEIGPSVVIGAGAVVTRSCEADSVYAGIPARKIR